jgi:ADP-ribose pyrophosphatase YjhB (NUDIX family)
MASRTLLAMGSEAAAKSLQAVRLTKQRQQVAAVCYRTGKRGIEFLLVQTRGGRWIFPKGGVEPGLTHAQSAALEAFEEGGVHGWMEEVAFARYLRRSADAAVSPARAELPVAAHLCEVTRLEPPQESNRNPTWFSAEKTKQRLLKDRTPEFGAELVRVVERALSRIERLHSAERRTSASATTDGLQKVRFEAHEDGLFHDEVRQALLARYFLRVAEADSPAIEGAVNMRLRKVQRLGAGVNSSDDTVRKITAIDSGRRADLTKAGSAISGKSALPKQPRRRGFGRKLS